MGNSISTKLNSSDGAKENTDGPMSVPCEADETDTIWRSFEKGGSWNDEYADALLEDIRKHEIQTSAEVKSIRILLLGPIKAGKSSFLNTVASIDRGRVSQIANTEGIVTSLTNKLMVYKPNYRLHNFVILDTKGVKDGLQSGLDIKDVLNLGKGHVSSKYQFNPASLINEKANVFRKDPLISQKAHCVVFVMDANVVGEKNVKEATKTKVHAFQDELKCLDIPIIVLLTKIDVLCEAVEKDVTAVYRSAKVKKAVDKAKALFRLPEQNIFPIQNYANATELDHQQDILTLLALKQMVCFGADSLKADSGNTEES